MTADRGTRRIGNRYRLGERLGSGGMGVVWAATDELLGRPVAVKEVIPPTGLTAEQSELMRSRSMREARAAARFTSRSAVNVYDVVEEDGRPWIVMELLDAKPLSDLINADGPLPPARVADIGGQLLEALTAAHASGVLHRDVKPSNVMIEAGGRVVLTDFGIAAMDGDPSLTTTGMLIGSPAYIAPERAHGEPASPASDLWSLGCTMFAALEGRPPFDRPGSLATLSAVLSEDPLPAPSAGPLASVLEGLLRKDPQQRLTAPDTDRLLRESMTAPTAPMREDTRHAGPPLSGGTTSVLPVVPMGAGGAPAGAASGAAPDHWPAAVQSRPPAQSAAPPREPRPAVSRPAQRPPGAPGYSRPRGNGSKAIIAAIVVTVLAVAAIVAAAIITNDADPDQTAAPGASASGSDPATDTDPASATDASDSATETSASDTGASDPATDTGQSEAEPTGGENANLPEGFRLYEDETGFSLAVPEDWAVTKEGPRTDFTEPGTGRFLRVDQTQDPQPDPVADWENQEASVSQRLPGYELIGIDPVDYRDYDAADWEFTWEPDEGPPLHVLNRNMITGPNRAYALYWNTPQDQWEDSLPVFETFTETFQPAP
ncbi:MAG: protein kinase [Geodermatophilaceae bacterium]|nr:protein kinase [Geodermatophilaceae bacterium]